ncbi:MAG: hypothetical protein U9N73_03095 [Candidatus Auribacterota bacterium]|nr:hypothetical protein [Candidatus Auribacterota bacterium]
MRIITGIILSAMLMLSPVVMGRDEAVPDESLPGSGFMYGQDGEEVSEEAVPPPPGRHGRKRMGGEKGRMGSGGRGKKARLQFKQFRREVKAIGEEIRENKLMIKSLEEELEEMEPGLPRAEVRKKLDETRFRQAELQVQLARQRVDFTRRARDLSQQRYDQARLGMERVKEKIKKEYPDLAAQLEPGPNPDF